MIVLMLVLLALLYGCTRDERPSTPIETPNPYAVFFDTLNEMDQYSLDIEVTVNQETYHFLFKRYQHISSSQVGETIDYFVKEEQFCYLYRHYEDGYRKHPHDCSPDEVASFLFFRLLDWTMFTELNGRYFMNLQSLHVVESFFVKEFPHAKVSNFEILFGHHHIESIVFDLTLGKTVYHHVMMFYGIHETIILLPDILEEVSS